MESPPREFFPPFHGMATPRHGNFFWDEQGMESPIFPGGDFPIPQPFPTQIWECLGIPGAAAPGFGKGSIPGQAGTAGGAARPQTATNRSFLGIFFFLGYIEWDIPS